MVVLLKPFVVDYDMLDTIMSSTECAATCEEA